jgi:hypothetical protein
MYSIEKYKGNIKIIQKITPDEFKLEWVNNNMTHSGTWKNYEIDIDTNNYKNNKYYCSWKTDNGHTYSGYWIGYYDNDKIWNGQWFPDIQYISEIYEYKINNYSNFNDSSKYEFKFGEFKEANNCGTITAKLNKGNLQNGDPDNKDYKNSCDIITDSSEKNIIFTNIYIRNLYDTIYLKENPKKRIVTNKSKNIEFFHHYCKKLEKILDELIVFYKTIKIENDGSGYIYKVNFNKDHKIIIFGDIHGSFHTIFRTFIRFHLLGIIDINTFTIKDGYTIIFLGDILDRGAFQVETLYLIFNLLLINLDKTLENPKIIYNCGNHEDVIINTRDGFKNDSINSCGNDTIFKKTNELLKYFPVAVIINNIYWLCHGGIVHNENDSDNDIFYKNIKKNNKNIIIIKQEYKFQIMWNDFYNGDKTRDNLLHIGDDIYQIGQNTLNSFLNAGFKFIFRGHADNFSNSWLLTNEEGSGYEKDKCYHIANNKNIDISKLLKYNVSDTNNRYFAQLKLDMPDKFINDINTGLKIYPVLTISTNTANGRDLNRDSYILLRKGDNI